MKEEITISQMQKEVDKWVQQFKEPYFPPLSLLAALTEEVGEVARVINRKYGAQKAKDGENLRDLEEELGDLQFVITCIANSEGIDLAKAHQRKMDKIKTRDINRYEKE